MSYSMISTVREAIASDRDLTAVDKLILLEFAWQCPEHGAPRVIRYKTYARILGLCPKNIRARVRILTDRGYFTETAVVVGAGAKLQGGVSHPPKAKTAGGSHTPPSGVSHPPQRGSHTPPLKEKENKKGPAALNLDDLGAYALACLRDGKPFLAAGVTLKPGSLEFERLSGIAEKQLRGATV